MPHKIQETPLRSWLVAGLGAFFQILYQDTFFWLWAILLISNGLDWVAGRWAAQKRGDFSSTRSREGLYSKTIGLSVVALLRSLEAVLPRVIHLETSTDGVFAATITVLLILEDIASLDRHRQTLGKAPIPLLSAAIRHIRRVTGDLPEEKE